MKHLFLIAASVLLLNNVFASSCQLQLPYPIFITDQQVVIKDHDQELLSISATNELSIRGQPQSLSNSQQQLVQQMGDGYRSLLPALVNLASDAVAIAMKAVTTSVNALFGDDPQLSQALMEKIDRLNQQVRDEIELQQRLGRYGYFDDLEHQFDVEIEAIVNEMITHVSGKAVLNLIAQALSDDEEEQKDLELRMDMLEKDLELEIEQQAAALEKTADRLCEQIAKMDRLEAELQSSLAAYQGLDLIRPAQRDL
jgi:phage-related minor tail protein